jgi:hypothetical protein
MRLILSSAAGAALGLLALAACSQTARADLAAAGPPAAGVCVAETYQLLVGQPAGEVDTSSLPQPVRILGASESLSPTPMISRMTIVTTGDGRVGEVVCN